MPRSRCKLSQNQGTDEATAASREPPPMNRAISSSLAPARELLCDLRARFLLVIKKHIASRRMKADSQPVSPVQQSNQSIDHPEAAVVNTVTGNRTRSSIRNASGLP